MVIQFSLTTEQMQRYKRARNYVCLWPISMYVPHMNTILPCFSYMSNVLVWCCVQKLDLFYIVED